MEQTRTIHGNVETTDQIDWFSIQKLNDCICSYPDPEYLPRQLHRQMLVVRYTLQVPKRTVRNWLQYVLSSGLHKFQIMISQGEWQLSLNA